MKENMKTFFWGKTKRLHVFLHAFMPSCEDKCFVDKFDMRH